MSHNGSFLEELPGIDLGATQDTQDVPLAPSREHSGVDLTGLSSNSACESIFTADDNALRMSPDTSRSIRKTRSAARRTSIIASSSSKNIGAPSLPPSTPFRGRAESNVMSGGTPHLDHVLSFYQKVSPPTFSHDIFSSFALESDTPGSRDSTYSLFGNWRFYSSGSGDSTGRENPPNSSSDASIGDSDSSEQGHQVILLPQPYSLPSAARSEPSFGSGKPSTAGEKRRIYLISRKHSKSLPALPFDSGASCLVQTAACSSTGSKRDNFCAFSMNSPSEAMFFARRSSDVLESDTTASSLATFEFVENRKKSARNGGRILRRPKLITKPFGRIQKVVNRLLN